MNDQDNVNLIKKTYASFSAGDVPAILANIDANAEWINHGPASVPYFGSWSGHGEVVNFFQAMGSSTAGGKVSADTFIAQDDRVVTTGRFTATVRETGTPIDTPIAHVFTVRNGKIVRWEGFSDSAHVADAHRGASAASR